MQILLSEDTYARVKDRMVVRRVGLVAVKGRAAACAVYELLGETDEVDAERLAWARRYEEALDHYLSRRWQEAVAVLDNLRRETPDDASIAFLTAACRRCAENEPPPEWHGVFTLETK